MGTFSEEIRAWADKVRAQAEEQVRELCLEVFEKIVLRSPVDTGHFRANWQIAIGAVPDGVLELEDKTGIATISAARARLQGVRAGDRIYIANNVHYGRLLEYGSSQQAPNGMVRTTLAEYGRAR